MNTYSINSSNKNMLKIDNYQQHMNSLYSIQFVCYLQKSCNTKVPSNLIISKSNPNLLISNFSPNQYLYDKIFEDLDLLYYDLIKKAVDSKNNINLFLYSPFLKDQMLHQIFLKFSFDIFNYSNGKTIKISISQIVNNILYDLSGRDIYCTKNLHYKEVSNMEDLNIIFEDALYNRKNFIKSEENQNLNSHMIISIIIENNSSDREREVDNFIELNIIDLDFYNDYKNDLLNLGKFLINLNKPKSSLNNISECLLSKLLLDNLFISDSKIIFLSYFKKIIEENYIKASISALEYGKWIRNNINNNDSELDYIQSNDNNIGKESKDYNENKNVIIDYEDDMEDIEDENFERKMEERIKNKFNNKSKNIEEDDKIKEYEVKNNLENPGIISNKNNLDLHNEIISEPHENKSLPLYTFPNIYNNCNEIPKSNLLNVNKDSISQNEYQINNENELNNSAPQLNSMSEKFHNIMKDNNINNNLHNPEDMYNFANDLSNKKIEDVGETGTNSNSQRNISDYDLQKLKMDHSNLLSSNIIIREDLNRLSDINKHLEIELHNQRQRNYELAADNDKLSKENSYLNSLIEKTNAQINRLKVKDENLKEILKEKNELEDKLAETEYDKKNSVEKSNNLEIELNILKKKYDDLFKENEKNEKELKILSDIQNNKMTEVENHLESLLKEIENLKNENTILKSEEVKIREKIAISEKAGEDYKEKYKEQKYKNEILNEKLKDIVEEFKSFKQYIEEEELKKTKEEELRRSRIENKNKLVSSLQKRIANYKNERLKKKNEESEINN